MTQIVCAHCGATNRVPAERLADAPVCGRCKQPLRPAHPVALTDAVFDGFIAKTELPVVVDFWAAWCGPCQSMAPHFEAAARAMPGLCFAKLDTDAQPQAAGRQGIRSIPTLIVYRGGREIARRSGALPAAELQRWVDAALAA